MENDALIDKVLRRQEVSVTAAGPWPPGAVVTLSLPDLRLASRRVWGDWGPMYAVDVPDDAPIEILVGHGTGAPDRTRVDIEAFRVDSPMLAKTRAVTPLVMKLPLPRQDCILEVAYDAFGEVASVDVVTVDPELAWQLPKRPVNAPTRRKGYADRPSGAHPMAHAAPQARK